MAQDVGALVLIANGEMVPQELCAVPLHATVHCRRTAALCAGQSGADARASGGEDLAPDGSSKSY